jgi:geranylgeranyl reductase family protein
MFDCIIVGAGPAGGSAAYHLAKKGHSVLVLEKESLPRYKPCGGAVSPQVAQWFDFDFSPAISLKLKKLRYTWSNEDPVELQIKDAEPIWMVKRDVFDEFLITQAKNQGAEVRDNTAVTGVSFKNDAWEVTTSGETVTGRYLIAADGASGPMAKLLGFKKQGKRRLAVGMEIPLASGEQTAPINFDFGQVKNGFIWNFPKADGFSLGTGTFIGGDGKKLDETLKKYATSLGLDVQNAKQYEAQMALWDGDRTLHTQNAVLAGEAASVVDPFTAEGIRPSMFSGIKAAEAIAAALGGDPNALGQYTEIMKEERGSDMVWAGRVASAFFRLPKIGYKVGVKKPQATRKMVQILCGELRYSEVVDVAVKMLSKGILGGG